VGGFFGFRFSGRPVLLFINTVSNDGGAGPPCTHSVQGWPCT